MDMNNRIKIKIEDNTCIIQPESIIKETITNSMSLNISITNNNDDNENGEISMESLFYTDKKSLGSSLRINDTPLNDSNTIQPFKPDNTKPTIKQLSILSNHTKTFCSAISLNKNIEGIISKNLTAALSTKGNTLSSFKTPSISNLVTSPFNSNINYSHSNSMAFNERKSPSALGINSKMVVIFKRRTNTTLSLNPKEGVDAIIGKKIIRNRSLSSRESRPASILIHSTMPNYNSKKNISRTMTMTMISLPPSNKKKQGMKKECIQGNNFWSSISTASLLDGSNQNDRLKKHLPFSLMNFIGDCIKKSISQTHQKCSRKALGKCYTCRFSNDMTDHVQLKKKQDYAKSQKYMDLPKKDISHHEKIGSSFRLNTCIGENTIKKVETINNFSHYVKKRERKIQQAKSPTNNINDLKKQKLLTRIKMNHPNITFNSTPFMINHKRIIML